MQSFIITVKSHNMIPPPLLDKMQLNAVSQIHRWK